MSERDQHAGEDAGAAEGPEVAVQHRTQQRRNTEIEIEDAVHQKVAEPADPRPAPEAGFVFVPSQRGEPDQRTADRVGLQRDEAEWITGDETHARLGQHRNQKHQTAFADRITEGEEDVEYGQQEGCEENSDRPHALSHAVDQG